MKMSNVKHQTYYCFHFPFSIVVNFFSMKFKSATIDI